MGEKKTKVARLTDSELSIIDALRQHGTDQFLSDISNALTLSECDQLPVFRAIRNKMNSKLDKKLTDYVTSGSMSSQCYELVLDALHTNKSIMITGGAGSGKTTLLNALLDSSIELGVVATVVEHRGEKELSVPEDSNYIEVSRSGSTNLVATVLKSKANCNRVIFSEIMNDEDIISLTSVMKSDFPVVFTSRQNSFTELVESHLPEQSQRLLSNIDMDRILVLRCDSDLGLYKVVSTQPIN